MARAKRTERAEARRRYRAAIGEPITGEVDEALDDEPAAKAAPAATRTTARSAASGSAPARPSIIDAFRSSFRPVDLRGDLRALPGLLRTKAFLAPVVASGLSVVAWELSLTGWTFIPRDFAQFFYQYFAYTFPVAAVFIAGFFAPRASWLLGGIVAIMAVLFQIALLVGVPGEVVVAILVQGAVYGSFFGAAAAWYRRFLSRANPNRGVRPAASTTSHRPDGKIPKRNTSRPMLARRR